MFDRIIVPLDGSLTAESAIRPAGTFARHAGANLILLHVMKKKEARYSALKYLYARARFIEDELGVSAIECLIKRGKPGPAIMKVADRESDLIVVTGDITDELMRLAVPPVLAIPVGYRADHPIKNIVVALDGSELAERALYIAATAANVLRARLTIIRVVGLLPLPLNVMPELTKTARSYVDDVANALRVLMPTVSAEVLNNDTSAGNAILRYVEDNDVDLICLTTHGEGGFKRLILGSVTHKMIRAGVAPVLVQKTAISVNKSDQRPWLVRLDSAIGEGIHTPSVV